MTAAMAKLSTPKLTRALIGAIEKQAPPKVGRFLPKMRYAHQGGSNPPLIVIHGSGLDDVPASYTRYLERTFCEIFKLQGTPLKIQYNSSKNPFEGKKPKPLTEAEQRSSASRAYTRPQAVRLTRRVRYPPHSVGSVSSVRLFRFRQVLRVLSSLRFGRQSLHRSFTSYVFRRGVIVACRNAPNKARESSKPYAPVFPRGKSVSRPIAQPGTASGVFWRFPVSWKKFCMKQN